jgi:predicted nucleic acid-binding protein
MGRLSDKLAQAGLVGLDSPVFIYHLEAHPRYSPLTKEVLAGMENGKWTGLTSAITLMEINVRPWQHEREEAARKYETVLVNFPNLTILDIDRDVARLASQLQARYNVRPPDALQVAASLQVGAKAFLTNYKRLSILQTIIEILMLNDFAAME